MYYQHIVYVLVLNIIYISQMITRFPLLVQLEKTPLRISNINSNSRCRIFCWDILFPKQAWNTTNLCCYNDEYRNNYYHSERVIMLIKIIYNIINISNHHQSQQREGRGRSDNVIIFFTRNDRTVTWMDNKSHIWLKEFGCWLKITGKFRAPFSFERIFP